MNLKSTTLHYLRVHLIDVGDCAVKIIIKIKLACKLFKQSELFRKRIHIYF